MTKSTNTTKNTNDEHSTNIRFESAHFLTSVAASEKIKMADIAWRPEVAFIGRSNAGKSSVINAIVNQKRLAYSSRTPGRTQLINFFGLRARNADKNAEETALLVDLPGYGFAQVDDATRERWDSLIVSYLTQRRMLRVVVMVMDSRHPWMPADLILLEWLMAQTMESKPKFVLLMNKCDKLNRAEVQRAILAGRQQLEKHIPDAHVQAFSTTHKVGITELKLYLDKALNQS